MIRSLVLAGMAMAAAPAGAFDYFVSSAVEFQSFRLWHDASGSFPVLGNPTSVLEYPVLVAPSLSLRVEGQRDGWDMAGAVSVAGFGRGEFRDRDYLAGGAVFSDTFSTAVQEFGLSGQVTLAPPISHVVGEHWSVTPILRGEAEVQGITNYGLRCGAVCLGGSRPDSLAVLRHLAYGARLGGGLRSDVELASGEQLRFELVGLAGGLFVDDSHLLRSDLGPVPNILYRNFTLSVDVDATYRKQISSSLAFTMQAGAGLDVGWGQATFAPATASASTYPAGFERVRLQAGLGLSGQFQ